MKKLALGMGMAAALSGCGPQQKPEEEPPALLETAQEPLKDRQTQCVDRLSEKKVDNIIFGSRLQLTEDDMYQVWLQGLAIAAEIGNSCDGKTFDDEQAMGMACISKSVVLDQVGLDCASVVGDLAQGFAGSVATVLYNQDGGNMDTYAILATDMDLAGQEYVCSYILSEECYFK